MRIKNLLISICIALGLVLPAMAFGATGGIDTPDYQARLCTNGTCSTYSQIYWRTTGGPAVSISDTALTGYLWSPIYGWINLNPAFGGVHNTTSGVLSGYAWGAGLGWVNFSPTFGGGVTIDTMTGKFSGYAWASGAGWMHFDCSLGSTACVQTSWRPTATTTTSGGGGGGTVIPSVTPPVIPPVTPPVTPPVVPPTVPPTIPPTPPTLPPTIPVVPPGPPVVTPVTPPTVTPPPAVSSGGTSVGTPAVSLLKKIFDFLNSKAGMLVTRAIALVGALGSIAMMVATGLFLNPLVLSDIVLIPVRFVSLLLGALGLTKRKRPWGVVYDSVTKQPLDPVYVILRNSEGTDVATAITDLDGRYGFVVSEPGNYMLTAQKTNYVFPSQKLVGRDHDELYRDLYFGEYFAVATAGEILHRNIPMDPERFDWNEFQKQKQHLMRFYSIREKWLARLSNLFFGIGFAVSLIALIAAVTKVNIAIFCLYIVLFFIRRRGLSARSYGAVTMASGEPVSFAVLRVSQASTNVEVIHRVADATGKYYCLLPNGPYKVRIDRKLPDGTYQTLVTNFPVQVTKGYLSEKFTLNAPATPIPPQPRSGDVGKGTKGTLISLPSVMTPPTPSVPIPSPATSQPVTPPVPIVSTSIVVPVPPASQLAAPTIPPVPSIEPSIPWEKPDVALSTPNTISSTDYDEPADVK